MDIVEYRREMKKKIGNELGLRSRNWGNNFTILSEHTRANDILEWLENNNDRFTPGELTRWGDVDTTLINCEKYIDKFNTKWDEEIEQLQQRLKELKELQKHELEKKKKNKKIAELKKQLKELEEK